MTIARHPFQDAGIERALSAPACRWMFGDETGLGKTNQAIGVLERLNAQHVLVICPAIARLGWSKELKRWWPNGPENAIIDQSPTRKNQSKKRQASWEAVLGCNIRIVSPELIDVSRDKALLLHSGGCLVLDEAHFYIDAATRRSRAVKELAKGFKGPIVGLSATPIPDRIVGLANVVDTMWPRRFGVFGKDGKPPYDFMMRYAERTWNGYGWNNGGINTEHAQELRERLGYMMSRTTRKEVAHLLPSCQVRPLSVHSGACLQAVSREWVAEARLQASHCVILTHLKKTARDIAHALACDPSLNVLHVDGEVPAEERNAKLALLREAPAGILVTTMHAVEQSISLSWCHRGLFAELYWSPKTLVQTMGRFPRMDSMDSILLDVLCGSNSTQERMAYVIADKMSANSAVIKESASEASLASAVGAVDCMSEAALIAAAQSCCSEEDLEALDIEDTLCEGD